MSEPALAVRDLSVSFGTTDVLAEASLALPAATSTALIGANGSGKTTLLRAIIGRCPATGTVDVAAPSDGREIGYLPQNPRFRAGFTVRETVANYARMLATDPSPDAALDRVGLEARDRSVAALSGGMRRLLGIAIALLGEPPVIVLDEPTSDLDPPVSAQIFDIVDELTASGQTVLLATHDPRGVVRTDRTLLLHEGEIEGREIDRDAVDPLATVFEGLTDGDAAIRVGGDGA
jgi:ABC-type multidrug transport system ATPase subunit